MKYNKPRMEFWDLEDENEVITTSLGNGGDNEEGGEGGDFNGDDVIWGF